MVIKKMNGKYKLIDDVDLSRQDDFKSQFDHKLEFHKRMHRKYKDKALAMIKENDELKNEISILNDLLDEYYTADTSETVIHKLKCLLTELKYFREASDTVDWQAYKEKEFERL